MKIDYLICNANILSDNTELEKFSFTEINKYKVYYDDDVSLSTVSKGFCVYISLDQKLGYLSSDEIKTLIESFYETGVFNYSKFKCKYSFVFVNTDTNELSCFTDIVKNINVYYYVTENEIAISSRLKYIADLKNISTNISNEAIYHYLNFTYIPSPLTIYSKIYKLEPSSHLHINSEGGFTSKKYWMPEYKTVVIGDENSQINAIKNEVKSSIVRNIPPEKVSTFLSGGTDSSVITSIVSGNVDYNLDSFSIGFNEEVFSELEYVDVVQQYLGHNSNKYKLSANESFSLIDKFIENYDEPFGNSSIIATYYCSKISSDKNYKLMMAGDGGDEVFGGNERYAKDYYFTLYQNLPGIVRKAIELPLIFLKPFDLRIFNRIRNFITRANKPNPERFYLDDSFASDHFNELLTDEFRNDIEINSSLNHMSNIYNQVQSDDEVNKLMYLDLMMAISENDITKVNTSTSMNCVDALYPYLDRQLIEYMAKAPAALKVNKAKKRYAYKKAVSGFVPDEILNKKKQGFGMPLSLWFKNDEQFHNLIKDVIGSEEFNSRQIFNPQYCQTLLDRHVKGVWDYSQELWIILNLELWLRKHA